LCAVFMHFAAFKDFCRKESFDMSKVLAKRRQLAVMAVEARRQKIKLGLIDVDAEREEMLRTCTLLVRPLSRRARDLPATAPQ
jgi:hypothetical protein